MANNPLVSIIIPTYNRWKYITRAINSCLNQTYENIEVLVIDDCSDDNTEEVVKSIQDDRLKYFKNQKNSWPCISRNNGIKFSKGQYINFLDDDDELLPDKIKLQLEKFESSDIENLGVVTWDVEYRRSDINEIKKNRKQGYIYKDLLKAYCISGTQQMLIRKEVFDKVSFDEKLEANQEYDLMIQISKYYNYDYLDKLVAIQNESENQISFNFRKKLNWTMYLYQKYKQEFKDNWVYGYNFLRYHYLFMKYFVGKVFWKKVYNLLP